MQNHSTDPTFSHPHIRLCEQLILFCFNLPSHFWSYNNHCTDTSYCKLHVPFYHFSHDNRCCLSHRRRRVDSHDTTSIKIKNYVILIFVMSSSSSSPSAHTQTKIIPSLFVLFVVFPSSFSVHFHFARHSSTLSQANSQLNRIKLFTHVHNVLCNVADAQFNLCI